MMRYLKAIQVLLLVGICSLAVSTAYGDFNWPYGPPPGSSPPGGGGGGGPGPKPNNKPLKNPCKKKGSIIGCEPQTLGEAINVTGTPLSLHYQSDRVPGRRDTHILNIQLSGATLPPGLQRIHLEIAVAGQAIKKNFAPQPNLVDTFTWDGKDAYGRTVQGKQPVKVRIGYEYIAQYYTTFDTLEASFNRFGTPPIAFGSGGGGGGGGGAVVFSFQLARTATPPIILWQDYEASSLGSLDNRDLGGWSPSLHHAYDVVGRTLYLGNGDQRNATAAADVVISTVAGTGDFGFAGDDGPATQAQLNGSQGVAVGSDGNLYIIDNNRIRRVGPDGIITTVAGNGIHGFSGDGGSAIQARLSNPLGVAVGSDGSLYIVDGNNNRIRRVGPDGIITTVVGDGTNGFSGDGGLATQAKMNSPQGVAIGSDSSLYIVDQGNRRIRRVGADGIITTVAGTGSFGFSGDGGLATLAQLAAPQGVAVGSDGSLYIADLGNNRIRRVGTDGIITTVAGTGSFGFSGDGGLATQGKLSSPYGVAVGSDGSLYIVDFNNQRIRRVGADGIITTVAGTGVAGFAADGGPATQGQLNFPVGVAVGSDGSLYIADFNNYRIRQLHPSLPGSNIGDIFVASEDGSELYVFNGTGRHLRTLDALTGAVRFQFTHNNAWHLAAITDGDNNVTTIERNGNGNPTAIVSPFGQRTTLAVNGDGYLSRVTNPAGEAVQLTYNSGDAEGLLATLTDPSGNTHRYLYDTQGRLIRDENTAGGVTTLVRTDITDNHYTVTLTSASRLVTTYEVEELSTGETRRVRIEASGARTESLIRTDGSRRVTYPDGTVANQVEGPDPRFGMQSPFMKTLTVTTPGGITASRSATRTATLSDPNNLLSLSSQTDTATINGQIYASTYATATRKVTTTTPAGRQFTTTLDANGRVITQQADVGFGLEPVHYSYDNHGRLSQLQQDTQSLTFGYDVQNRLSARTNAAGSSIDYLYDAADRPTHVSLPSNRGYSFAYDANGNRIEVTMPDLGIHLLDYTSINLEAGYAPPSNSSYVSLYDTDQLVSKVTLPSGRTETFSKDSGNRLTNISYPEATVALSYAVGDTTQRVDHISRTPMGSGAAQEIAFTYNGDLVIGTTLNGAASGQYIYAYDSNFLLQSLTLNSGADTVTTTMARDNDGLLTGLGPFTFTRTGPTGDPTKISDGTLTVTLGYDMLGRIASRIYTVAGLSVFEVHFTFDNVGRISKKTETVQGISHIYDYTYDTDSQLSEVKRDGALFERYTYDLNRNRLSRQLGGALAETASYDGQDRLIQQAGVIYQFDADGYLTQRGSTSFQYSTTGELLQATVGGLTQTYAYDGLRRRVSRTNNAGTTQYLYGNPGNDLQVSNTRDPAGVLTTYYYDDGGRLFAMLRGSTRYYIATDQLGSPRIVTDTVGTLVKELRYDSFGNITLDTNPAFALPIGFAGGVADGLTGMVRFGFRDFDPEVGRWTSRDPTLFAGRQANLYMYGLNNPVNVLDGTGLFSAGGSSYNGLGGGGKVSITSEGFTLCGEIGYGTGTSLEMDPFADLDDSKIVLAAQGKARLGPLGGELGGEAGIKIDDCNEIKGVLKPKGKVCGGPYCLDDGTGSSFKINPQGKSVDQFFNKAGKNGFQAKGILMSCQKFKF